MRLHLNIKYDAMPVISALRVKAGRLAVLGKLRLHHE